MKFVRSLIARFRAWRLKQRFIADLTPTLFLTTTPSIHRDVTRNGVRVYSLCGSCGARLECSATLCEECAQGPHPTAF